MGTGVPLAPTPDQIILHISIKKFQPIAQTPQSQTEKPEKNSFKNTDFDSESYADTFFGFKDLEQNEAVVNLLVLLLQNINEKMEEGNEKTATILDFLSSQNSQGKALEIF